LYYFFCGSFQDVLSVGVVGDRGDDHQAAPVHHLPATFCSDIKNIPLTKINRISQL
jgi:hypothetical protein